MGSVNHILYQVKNVDVPNTAYDTGFSPFTEEKDFTICLEWQILSGINSSGNIIFMILGSDGNTLRTLQAAYYNNYFYFDVFGNRRATQNRHMVDYKINRAVATYSNGTLKSYFIGVGGWTKNNVAFVITDATIKIGSAGRTNSCKLREFTFYDYAMTEEEALEYINAPMQFSSEYLVARRRQIMLTTPHLETVSGTVVSFSTDLRSNFKECKIHFTPIQEGSGDPSPDNVRPIHGWDGVTVNHNNNSLTIPFPQTIYGGYVDLVKGEVVEEWAKWVEDGSRAPAYWVWTKDDTNAVYTALMPALPVGSRHNPEFGFIGKVMCPNRHYVGINSSGVRTPNIISLYRAQNSASFAYSFTGEEFSSMTKEELKAYIAENPIESVYILLTPRTYPLDPVTIRTLKGLNSIWSDANGNIEIKYWKR